MKTYRVFMYGDACYEIEVEAKSPKQAKKLARQELNETLNEPYIRSSYSGIDTCNWGIDEIEEVVNP